MTYIQDKLDELDDRFAIIIDEKIDDKVYKNIDYGDFYGRRDEFKDFIKEIFVDYHNHIVEKIEEYANSQTDKTVAMGIIGTISLFKRLTNQ
jgi:hypothetical protein